MGSYPTGNRKFQKNSKIQKTPSYLLFKPKQVGKSLEREKIKKKKSFRWVPTRPGIGNSKKIAKKFKNLENTIIPSFQVKIGWKRPRKRENKKKKSFRWVPTRPGIANFKKIAKKFKNLENTIIASFQAKIGRERLTKREKKKKIVLMDSYPTGNRKF